MLPIGHTNAIKASFFSADDKKIITASFDNTLKIWDANSGLLLYDLTGHKNLIISAFLSSDGKKIISASFDGTVKIWDAENGIVSAELKNIGGELKFARFTNDSKKIVIVTTNLKRRKSELSIWDGVNYKPIIQSFPTDGYIDGVELSPDGRSILLIDNGKAQVWDIIKGEKLLQFSEFSGSCQSALFSKDGKKIVTTSDSLIKVWDSKTGSLLFELRGHKKEVNRAIFNTKGTKIISLSKDSTAVIWDAMLGKALKTIKGEEVGYGNEFANFSPDGNLAFISWGFIYTYVYDVFSGNIIDSIPAIPENSNAFSFNKDGTKVVIGSQNNTTKIWDIRKAKLILNLQFRVRALSDIYKYPRLNYLILDSYDEEKEVWDASKIKLVGNSNRFENPFFSDSLGKKQLYVSYSNEILVGDINADTILFTLKGHTRRINTTHFSPNGNKIVSIAEDSTIKVWDVLSRRLLLDVKEQRVANTVEFSNDGNQILYSLNDFSAKIIDVETGESIVRLVGHKDRIVRAIYNPDCKKVATASLDSTVIIWDSKSGKPLFTLQSEKMGRVLQVIFNKSGSLILTRSSDFSLRLWDGKSGKLINEMKGHSGDIGNAIFSEDDKIIFSVSEDNTARAWDGNNGNFLFKFFKVDSSDYLVTDQSGRFDGTEAARKLLYFTCGSEVITLDQVKDQLWVPNLAERIMKGETINAKALDELNICGLTPEVDDASSGVTEYNFKITPRRGGLGETVLYVNGIEAKRYKPAQLQKIGGVYQLRLKKDEISNYFITGKQNPVTVKAYTSDNSISSRGLIINEDKTKESFTPPNLYAVMVGVSDYKGDELDLKYAAKDATDISAVVSNAAKKLLNSDGKEHVFMYNLTTAKEHFQLPEKNSIKKVLEEIGKKATANDILMIFFAGHGVMEGDRKQFYFLTADASKASATSASGDVGISTTELAEWMSPQNIKAQKRVLIFDACNSGQAIKDFVKMGNDNQNYLAARNDDKAQQIKTIEKLNEKSGLFILSASASNQSAYEMGRYSQGLLTYSLLKAIKQQPDILEDGKYLNLSRWFNAAEKTVSELSKENGARQEPQIVANTNFNIGVVDEEVMAKIILPTEKPLFAASNFQNADENITDDNLELSNLINGQLAETSSRGTDSRIIYVTATNSPDAFLLIGRYDVKGEDLTVKVNIKQGKEIKFRFEVKGRMDSIKGLAEMVVQQATEWIMKNK